MTLAGTATDQEKPVGRRNQSWNEPNRRETGPAGGSQKLNTRHGRRRMNPLAEKELRQHWPGSKTKIKTEQSARGKEPVKSKAGTPTENKTHEPEIQREGRGNTIKQDAKSSLLIEIDTRFLQSWMSSPSLSHLIEMKIGSWHTSNLGMQK
jgi:hypothetical protein